MTDWTVEELDIINKAAVMAGLIRVDQCMTPNETEFFISRLRAIDRVSLIAREIVAPPKIRSMCPSCGKYACTFGGHQDKPNHNEYRLIHTSLHELSKMDPTATGTPTHIAYSADGETAYVWPSPRGKLEDLKPAKPLRYEVENIDPNKGVFDAIDTSNEKGLVLKGVKIKPIKPITHSMAGSASVDHPGVGRCTGSELLGFLKRLGFEVED